MFANQVNHNIIFKANITIELFSKQHKNHVFMYQMLESYNSVLPSCHMYMLSWSTTRTCDTGEEVI